MAWRDSFLWPLLSGLWLAAAFPPFGWHGLAWVGLVPLLHAVQRAKRLRTVFLQGLLAGTVFFLFTVYPLVSASSWTGWAAESPEAFNLRLSHQWWFLRGLWVAWAVWGALWWGAWALVVRRAAGPSPWRLLLIAPSAWVVLAEWARSRVTFDFAWAFLGNAAADHPAIRQLAALGGVWALSALIVLVNVGVMLACQRSLGRRRWLPCAACALLLAGAWAAGMARLRRPIPSAGAIPAAVMQRTKPAYHLTDFASTGLDRGYLPMAEEALRGGAALVVLPESIALGTVTLDGTSSKTKPPQWQHPRAGWDAQMAALLQGRPAIILVGLDTVERGQDHNTLVAWEAQRPIGWYHKQQLVPFSEYEPWPWAPWAIRGQSQYSPGQGSQLIRVSEEVVLGGFICQEVLFAEVTRRSVRDGATLLITGGNDGVFGDPAVALVHADLAQLRAVETGRYILRAMKTGISAVIDPYGREVVRSRSSEPATLQAVVVPSQAATPYVRFGNWLIGLSALVVAGLLTSASRVLVRSGRIR